MELQGKILKETGRVFDSKEVTVVHTHLLEGQKIAAHEHPGQEVFFTLVKGEVEAYLNDNETHQLTPGEVLAFDGDLYISILALKDSDFFVYLVNKH